MVLIEFRAYDDESLKKSLSCSPLRLDLPKQKGSDINQDAHYGDTQTEPRRLVHNMKPFVNLGDFLVQFACCTQQTVTQKQLHVWQSFPVHLQMLQVALDSNHQTKELIKKTVGASY